MREQGFKLFWVEVITGILQKKMPNRTILNSLEADPEGARVEFYLAENGDLSRLCSLDCNSKGGRFTLETTSLLEESGSSAAAELRTGFGPLSRCSILLLSR